MLASPTPPLRIALSKAANWRFGDEAQGQAGYCKFADGSECEEWALLRGECKPGQPAGQFTDPFAYCAAVGTLDQPDNR